MVSLDNKIDIKNDLLQGDSARIVAILGMRDQSVPADVVA